MLTPKIYCPVRQQWVANQPEEVVRQELIKKMLHHLGYPLASIGVEKSLKQMPHLALHPTKLPTRRADIICFSSGRPLLLIECKAAPWNARALRQVIGYNHYLAAPAIALAAPNTLRLGLFNPSTMEYQFTDGLPFYPDLIQQIAQLSSG